MPITTDSYVHVGIQKLDQARRDMAVGIITATVVRLLKARGGYKSSSSLSLEVIMLMELVSTAETSRTEVSSTLYAD